MTGRFALAGAVDLSGPGHGVGYRSSDENVAVVTPDGQLVARANGETTVEVEYGGFAEEVLVIVDSSAHLDALELLPPGASIPRVGDSLGLRLEGILSDGRRVDLTPGAIGTIWSTSDAATLTVSSNGTATAHRAGSATVFAEHAGRIASLLVDALDGPPEIRLQAPRTVQAGTTLTLRALANDDVRVDYVEFQVDGVPAARDSEAPYELQVAAPPFAGPTLALGAVVVDSGGNRVEAEPVDVRVTGAPPPSSKQIVYEMPSPGAMLVEKLPHVIRVTSGPRPWCNLSTLDFQVVRFSVDDAPIGECATPRVEIRMANCIPGSKCPCGGRA